MVRRYGARRFFSADQLNPVYGLPPYSTVRDNPTVRCGAFFFCGAVRCGAVRCGAVRCGADCFFLESYGAMRFGAVLLEAKSYGAVRSG